MVQIQELQLQDCLQVAVIQTFLKHESEEYDGTSWSEGNNLGTARKESEELERKRLD